MSFKFRQDITCRDNCVFNFFRQALKPGIIFAFSLCPESSITANRIERAGRKAAGLRLLIAKGYGSRVAGQVEHLPKMLRLTWRVIIILSKPPALPGDS